MKFVQLILRKIIKIVANRCQILRLKCTKFDFRPRCGSLQRSPDPLAGFEGPTSKGGEGGEGGKGREEEAFLVMWPRRLSALNPPLGLKEQTKQGKCLWEYRTADGCAVMRVNDQKRTTNVLFYGCCKSKRPPQYTPAPCKR